MKYFLLFLVLCTSPWNAFGQDITIVTEEWPPYNYSEDGEAKGVVTDIVKEVMSRAGMGYTIEVLPWARSYKMAMEEENVMIYSIFKLPNRESLFQWIPVEGLAVRMYLFKPRHRTDIHIDSLESAKQFVVGVTRDTSTHHYLLNQGFEENTNLIPLPSEKQNIQLTLPGVERTDLLTGDILSLTRWLKLSGLDNDYLEEQLFLFKEDIYFAFGLKTSPGLVDRIRRAAAEVSTDGTLENILLHSMHTMEHPAQ